jgi:flagellar protein FlaG
VASVSSSTLIIFIASLLVAASVAGTMTNGVQRLSGALGDRSIDVSNEIRSDVEIISDAGSPDSIYDSGANNLTLLIKNSGSQEIAPSTDSIDVIVDGEYQIQKAIEVVDGTEWTPGNVVRLNATDVSLSSGDHRVVVIVNGDREVLKFRT